MKNFEKNVSMIIKSSTDSAKAYLNSPMFRASLALCSSFKIISNNVR